MDNLLVIASGFKDGLFDSIIFGIRVIGSMMKQSSTQSSNVYKRICQCCYLSFLLMISMFIFNFFLKMLYLLFTLAFGSQDSPSSTWSWLEMTLSYLFSAFWVLPLIFISRIVTALWFQDIADTSFRGRPQPFRSISQLIADTLISLVIQLLFLIQTNLFYLFPIGLVGQLISILHTSLLYSLYSFEYKWYNMGWELHRRLYYIERMWPYFAGFGLPLALTTHFVPNYYINTAVFSFLFPLFILSANETNQRASQKDNKIPFFSFAVWLANKLVHIVFKSNALAWPLRPTAYQQ